MTEPVNQADLVSYLRDQFHAVSNFRKSDIGVAFNPDETITIHLPGEAFYLMEIGSDDDRYRFELWLNGRDTGIYVEFALYGEEL